MERTETIVRRILSQPHGCIHCDDGTDRIDSMSIMALTGQFLYLIKNQDDEYMLRQLTSHINDEYPKAE